MKKLQLWLRIATYLFAAYAIVSIPKVNRGIRWPLLGISRHWQAAAAVLVLLVLLLTLLFTWRRPWRWWAVLLVTVAASVTAAVAPDAPVVADSIGGVRDGARWLAGSAHSLLGRVW